MSTDLENRIVIVTGAAAGIGRAVAERFHADGARVIALDRDAEGLGALAEGRRGIDIWPCEIGDRDSVERCVQRVIDHNDRIDALINNAALEYRAVVEETTPAQWQNTFQVNLEAMQNLARAAVPTMMRRGGFIVNVSSIQVQEPIPGCAAYAASKGGVEAWTRALASDLGPYGVRVNAVAPGAIDSERRAENPADWGERTKHVRSSFQFGQIPMGRKGLPEEIAGAVRFLCSPDASYVNGHVLVVDGGKLCGP